MVTQNEIIEALRLVGGVKYDGLANRIESEGIAPKPYVPMTDKEWREYFDDDMSGLSYNFYREIEAHIIKRAGLEIKHD